MDVMILIGSLLLGGLINFLKDPDKRTVSRLAGIYIFIALVIAMYSWLFYFVGGGEKDLLKVIGVFLKITGIIAHALLGYLVAYVILDLQQASDQPDQPENDNSQRIIRLTLWAISLSIGNSFLIATVGKIVYITDMMSFFKQSGYAVWFLYFIMAAEACGAFGILLHYKLKTGIWAALGLILIMLGAVYTHWHNKDPFSDSYAALNQVINLSLLLVLYYFEKYAYAKQVATPIYVV